jgi:hypothetical protein
MIVTADTAQGADRLTKAKVDRVVSGRLTAAMPLAARDVAATADRLGSVELGCE